MSIEVRKLETTKERLEGERLIATAFLQEWDKEEARKEALHPKGETWGAFRREGEPVPGCEESKDTNTALEPGRQGEGEVLKEEHLVSAVTTLRHDMFFEGKLISCGELHMVGTLPEERGSGAINLLLKEILTDYRARGDLFATLIPFSFAFYRKYGFEMASELLVQRIDIHQFASFHQELKTVQVLSQEDVDKIKKLHISLAQDYNLVDLRGEEHWTYNGNGEFGKRDWQYLDKPHYSYLFSDAKGKVRSYLTFVFVPGPDGPFTGCMKVLDMAFDSPRALHSLFAFFYGMRAKIKEVEVTMPREVDFSLILPEAECVQRSLDSHIAARILNVEPVLATLRYPQLSAEYTIRVNDDFLPENTGTYRVVIERGIAVSVTKQECTPDLEVTIQTLCQLALGLIDLPKALYREGTSMKGNRNTLEKVFVKKPIFLN